MTARVAETPAAVALDMARASAIELASRKVKRKPNNVSTASLAAHLASFVTHELQIVDGFIAAEMQARKRDESARAEHMHAAAAALQRVDRVLRTLKGGA